MYSNLTPCQFVAYGFVIQYKEYYLENRDVILERGKKYHIENQDKINAYTKEWRRNNPQRVKELARSSAERNKHKLKGYLKSFFSRHPNKAIEYYRNRRARKLKSGGKIALDEWTSLCDSYGNRCLCCGRTDVKLTLDHVIPLKLGGIHSIENAQPLCQSCNSKKHVQTTDYRI